MCFSRGEYDLCHGRNLEDQDKEVSCETPEEEALSVSPQCLTHFPDVVELRYNRKMNFCIN
jgi:hypothetical protein